jgi:FkbM family methyltransferase
MPRLTTDRLIRGARRRLAQWFDHRLVRWYRLGEYQQAWYLRRLLPLLDVDLVLDVGGNEGQFARFLRSRVGYRGPLVTFEPIPELAARLRKAAARDSNWIIVEAALGDVARSDFFNVMKSSPLSSLLQPSAEDTQRLISHNEVARRIPIQIRTLDDVMAEEPGLSAAKSIYLKLDVQGYERKVLDGAHTVLPRVAALQTELSVLPLYQGVPDYKELMAYIERLGYVLSFIPSHNYEQFPDMIDFDGHFVQRARLEQLGLRGRRSSQDA